jgi:phosphoribosylaminoimidazolecarboxamide formyltransferase/IMP cyclohydrolase
MKRQVNRNGSIEHVSPETKFRALISVYNKEGIADLARCLSSRDWEILSTGGTAKYLKDLGIPISDVSSITGFPECLDGRVKTLHPAVHAGLLARRDDDSHMKTLEGLKIGPIDILCVNLYPFFEKVKADLSQEETIEFIDIGGPAMLRSAAKNFHDVIVLSDPEDYRELIDLIENRALEENEVPPEFRQRLAAKVFDLTSAYDAAIARYLLKEEYPEYWPCSLKKKQSLRYGENAHQPAALYIDTGKGGALAGMEQLNGRELGYNNIRDLDLAWKAVCAFGLYPEGIAGPEKAPPLGQNDILSLLPKEKLRKKVSCAAVKHNTPCGIALGDSAFEAYEKTFACDPVSIFGGIVAFNAPLDGKTAEKLAELFLEIVAAPAFEEEALETLKKKKNLRIMRACIPPREIHECIAVDGGLLVQEADRKLFEKWETVTRMQGEAKDIEDMIFGMRAVSFVKSNAVMIVNDEGAVGIGGGQVNRIWPARDALRRGAEVLKDKKARVLASDAFFPFPDIVEAAAAAGIRAIVQPGGSLNDRLSIEACDKYGIAMVFTGTRHFKH